MIHHGAIFSTALAFLFIHAVCLSAKRAYAAYERGDSDLRISLATGLLSVPLNWPLIILGLLRPLYVTLFPPHQPDRKDLLVYDKSGLASPINSARRVKWTKFGLGVELYWFITCIHAAGMFTATFYY